VGQKDSQAAEKRIATKEHRVNGVTLDAGGLIALQKNDRRVFLILERAMKEGGRVLVPATALAQVVRNPAKQVRLWRMIQRDETEIVPLDGARAQEVGVLLSKTGTSDIADAHVVVCARKDGFAVITSDPNDLRRLEPRLRLVPV